MKVLHKNINSHLKTEMNQASKKDVQKFVQKKIDDLTIKINWKVQYDNKILFLNNLLTIVERL